MNYSDLMQDLIHAGAAVRNNGPRLTETQWDAISAAVGDFLHTPAGRNASERAHARAVAAMRARLRAS